MFRPSDERRVQAHLDAVLPAPYEATVRAEQGRLALSASVMDPDDATLPVVQATWLYDPSPAQRAQKQPREAELTEIGAAFVAACNAYTAAKAGG